MFLGLPWTLSDSTSLHPFLVVRTSLNREEEVGVDV